MKIAILGAGALGCAFGGRLAQAGHEVQLLARNPAHLRAINEDGLQLTIDGVEHLVEVAACRPDQARGPVDLVVLLTKTFHSDAALSDARALLTPEVAVLSLQNGLGNGECVSRHVAPENVLIGMSMTPADLTAPGQVSLRSSGQTMFMFADGQHRAFGEALETACQAAGINATYGADILSAIWEKVAFNSATNAMLGVTRSTPGILLQSSDAMALAKDLVAETIKVAHASGVDASEARVQELIALSASKHPDHKPSMLQDLLAGRRTEVDSINGAIVAQAKKLGLFAPLNEVLYRLVKTCETRG